MHPETWERYLRDIPTHARSRSEEFAHGTRHTDTFSLSEAKNDEGEWTMSPEQIRSEMNYDPHEGGSYDDPYDRY
jgi:hypothetical protein